MLMIPINLVRILFMVIEAVTKILGVSTFQAPSLIVPADAPPNGV